LGPLPSLFCFHSIFYFVINFNFYLFLISHYFFCFFFGLYLFCLLFYFVQISKKGGPHPNTHHAPHTGHSKPIHASHLFHKLSTLIDKHNFHSNPKCRFSASFKQTLESKSSTINQNLHTQSWGPKIRTKTCKRTQQHRKTKTNNTSQH